MTAEEIKVVRGVVYESLDRAEEIWGKVGVSFSDKRNIVLANESVESRIPGHREVHDRSPQIDDFIALVADMRDSSKHLMTRIAAAKITELQRVFYETSALIPGLATGIRFGGGTVTEYLGDGILALFQAGEDDEQRHEAIRAAHSAARNCLEIATDVVNPTIAKRYSLPPLEIGVGLSFSKAIVSTVGDAYHREGKVFGKCVYYASKLSGGRNQIFIDNALKLAWPKSKGGMLRFLPYRLREIDGYLLSRRE